MQKDTKKNYQLYGRNDMIMLDEHNKIYGSLGMAEPYIVATKEGETLLLDGAKDNEPFIGLSIYGKSHQNTVAGNQLFDANQISDGFVNGADAGESFAVSTNPEYPNAQYVKVKTIDINIIAWNLMGCVKTGVGESGIRIRYFDAEGVSVKEGGIAPESGSSETQNADSVYVLALYGFTEEAKSKAMLNAGATALPWEPYTGGQPSPNPDYPQEIVSVGHDGEIGMNVYGGNLLESIYGAKNRETVTGGKGNANTDDYSDSTFVELPGYGHKRVMQWISSHTSGYSLYIRLFDKNKNHLELSGIKYFSETGQQNVHYAINVPVEAMYYCITGEGYQCIVDEIMLNIGSTALPFEPYKQPQSLIVSTPNGLPGIPVSSGGNYTDENGQKWISDEVDYRRGKYVKRVVKYTGPYRVMGWSESKSYFLIANQVQKAPEPKYGGYCNISGRIIQGWEGGDSPYWFLQPSGQYIVIYLGDKYNTEELTQQFMNENEIVVCYVTKNPTETDLTPEQITAYQSLHTNYPTTMVMNDEGAGLKAIYKQIENGG